MSDIKDSGQRQVYETGAQRDNAEGKGDYTCLPQELLRRTAVHMEKGAAKYGKDNWRKGMSQRRYLDAALRHLTKFAEGHRDEDHIAAVVFNLGGIVDTEAMVNRGLLPDSLLDLPDWVNPSVNLSPAQLFNKFKDKLPKPPKGWEYTGEIKVPTQNDNNVRYMYLTSIICMESAQKVTPDLSGGCGFIPSQERAILRRKEPTEAEKMFNKWGSKLPPPPKGYEYTGEYRNTVPGDEFVADLILLDKGTYFRLEVPSHTYAMEHFTYRSSKCFIVRKLP